MNIRNRIAGHFGPTSQATVRLSIQEAITAYQVNSEWSHRNAVRFLTALKVHMIRRFKIQAPEVVIGIGRLPAKTLGSYRQDQNELGIKHVILISENHIRKANPQVLFDVVGTLLHELLHAEQCALFPHTKGNRHNRAFRQRAAALGLIVLPDGTQGYAPQSKLLALLAELGIPTPELTEPWMPQPKPAGKSTLFKYICGCPKPQTFRSGRRNFRALCPDCGCLFFIEGQEEPEA